MGHAEIKRASEIIWDKHSQRWMVNILTGPFSGQQLTARMWKDASGQKDLPKGGEVLKVESTLLDGIWLVFVDYDDAVAAEIKFLNAMMGTKTMTKQVITVEPDGTTSGLQVKKGRGLNLQSMGHARTVRISEIVWDEHWQAWFINVLHGPAAGPISLARWREATGAEKYARVEGMSKGDPNGRVLYFDDYDRAVAVEIEYLDALRTSGIF